jgi:hypothetical protein
MSTLELFGRGFVLVTNGAADAWRDAALSCAGMPVAVRPIGGRIRDVHGTLATKYGLGEGGAALVRPDGVVAWRTASLPADPGSELRAVCEAALGRTSSASMGKEAA